MEPTTIAILGAASLATAIVSAASHRDDVGEILWHAARGAIVLVVGLLVFMVAISFVFEWLLP